MKNHIEQLLKDAVATLKIERVPDIIVTPARDAQHGDYASNIALMLAKIANLPPRQLAEKIIAALPASPHISQVEIAGPGFINFFLAAGSQQQVIAEILQAGAHFGEAAVGKGKRVHIEYVSANPNGPLHVGHGRGAAYGACVANLLNAIGYAVHREYYVNDAGRQMSIFALSVWLRYLQQHDETIALPQNAYQGQYVIDIANRLTQQYDTRFLHSQQSIEALLSKNEDPDIYVDNFIQTAKTLLKQDFQIIFQTALDSVLADIKNDLAEFGVTYDEWFLESRLLHQGLIKQGIELLEKHDYVYEKDGAKWFRATSLGDEKDRVLVRKNGVSTYFASDVAYHLYKYRQGYHMVVDVFGADHHGFIARINAFLKALGEDPQKLHVLLVQFAILYRSKERVSMSTRGGTFVTLRELRNEVGNDAARFFYVMRKPDQHLDFDLELAKSKSSENPVYYIQYAHARICSIWRQLKAQDIDFDRTQGLANLALLTSPHEKELLATLAQYADTVKNAGVSYQPHLIAHYLQTLANCFHTYYNAERFLVKDTKLRDARLALIAATQQVLVNGLKLLGVSAPEEM
jgi:arginyl-tRNA synthetase